MMPMMCQQFDQETVKKIALSEHFQSFQLLQPGREAKENIIFFVTKSPTKLRSWPAEGPAGLRRLAARAELLNQIKPSSKALTLYKKRLDQLAKIMVQCIYLYKGLVSCALSREAKNFRFPGGADMRTKITLACTECKQRNYNTMKNKKNDPDRLEMNKYCRFCRKHTLHRETK